MYKIAPSENRLAQGLLRTVGAFLCYVHFWAADMYIWELILWTR